MAGNYTVKQGDTIPSIASDYGFTDPKTIWNDPNNAQLKGLRKNPNVLFPGDQVYIPDKDPRIEDRPTDQLHKFVKHKPPLKLKLVLEDIYEKPIANAECQLILGNDSYDVTTDDNGRIEQPVKPNVKTGSIIIKDPQTAFQSEVIPIKIGYLDPVEELSGQLARLDNLGYFPGDGSDDAQFESAVEEFQCDNNLTVDGVCGPGTQAKLKEIHGC
jgi:N-acetylmuramoyl-L-alanine amidase